MYYEYAGQPGKENLYIALKHDNFKGTQFCYCIRATSQLQRFLADKALFAACVFYKARALQFFDVDTIIDPSNYITMRHSTLASEAKKGRYRIEGKMPQDFHKKIVDAIRKHPVIEPKNKAILLACIGETL